MDILQLTATFAQRLHACTTPPITVAPPPSPDSLTSIALAEAVSTWTTQLANATASRRRHLTALTHLCTTAQLTDDATARALS
ncbi:hypothetical protein ACUY3K_02925 [Corynebacterium uberis]|uniref:hypothetical protein n=1 Tax=Corynebacterium TaxID=1716 RepID=UPI001D0AC9DB|nr:MULTISPECIES: hypothetical protein [Corynebacterium]MCZ9309667.1 hypothetical protein [Corynebacterium sp. c6VSa_13]UDL73471.1 hypothetical protein LH391_10400 [Corynebacterium uberis]UDL75649.1 hypothetical protein LH393_10525 [Corynebacterium uberis]UDL77862.1 hypothetical protein LH394_10510 [Corynebacterium uberis]UDL80145.1 hypothetical protein LH392_10930 [Corynebacterium uberis]